MPILTDLPLGAIETSRKMLAPLGKVPFSATVSQPPFVEIRAVAGALLGAVDVDGEVVVADGLGLVAWTGTVVDGLDGVDGVGALVTGVSPTIAFGPLVDVLAAAGAAAAGGAAAGDAAGDRGAESCWTKGSLLPKSPNETSWFGVRSTTMRSVSANRQPDEGVIGPATLEVVVGSTGTAASRLPCESTFIISKP